MAPQPMIDAIGIVASDLAASIAFYRRLGLAFPADDTNEHVEAPIGTTGVRVMLDSEELMKGLDALYAELAADGFGRTVPYDAPWGQRYAQVADPDGQAVDLYAPMPEPPTT